MDWDTNLLPDQKNAVCKFGCHICILAGPGTGKTLTLTRRVQYLIQEQSVVPSEILALTFTRAAAYELKNRVVEKIPKELGITPRISTLHSFALRQLLHNASIITVVPRPLRIADDWEEQNIIFEDLKKILNTSMREIKKKFQKLSADWETLNADKSDWEAEYPDPQFLGAWRKHREIYGYMLRSELVYQLKKSMEQNPDFTIEQLYKHILIDEYQDLNKCDLEIIKKLANSGIFIYACGDDDQSIYGFRFAYPQGIRMFNQEYNPCEILLLENCIRCGENILKLALFIANLDNTRLQKTLISYNQEQPGEVNLFNFPNENEEAKCIAKLCKYFIDIKGVIPKDILILTRNDRHGVFSSILKEALDNIGIPVATQANIESILDEKEARVFLSILRLLVNPRDQLAWLSILKIRNNGIGEKTISKIYEFAVDQGITFVDSLIQIINSTGTLDVNVGLLIDEYKYINDIINKYRDVVTISTEEIISLVTDIANDLINDEAIRVDVINYLTTIINTSEVEDLQELLMAMSTSLDDKEQDIDNCCVNIMTMHKAKGLSAEVVFIIAAEDEYLPGTQTGAEEGDARRLLYVSLTRAKKYLYITYCCERIGRQRFTGSKPNTTRRTLSRFLIDAPLTPENGLEYTRKLTK